MGTLLNTCYSVLKCKDIYEYADLAYFAPVSIGMSSISGGRNGSFMLSMNRRFVVRASRILDRYSMTTPQPCIYLGMYVCMYVCVYVCVHVVHE